MGYVKRKTFQDQLDRALLERKRIENATASEARILALSIHPGLTESETLEMEGVAQVNVESEVGLHREEPSLSLEEELRKLESSLRPITPIPVPTRRYNNCYLFFIDVNKQHIRDQLPDVLKVCMDMFGYPCDLL